MGALGDVARDFVEVELHHVGVGIGRREGRPNAAGGADGAEQIGVVMSGRAPADQGLFFGRCAGRGCGHVFGL